jgi:hypothetical protein
MGLTSWKTDEPRSRHQADHGARRAGPLTKVMLYVAIMANETNRLASGYQVEIDEKFRVGQASRPAQ